ncbi:hypothetical protein B0H14DRAFT_3861447 [Mycena olivaceomarginata]|nr:hypothetical protein B0H14DRAFT_3861447 [Mycena olivaceomarginata]
MRGISQDDSTPRVSLLDLNEELATRPSVPTLSFARYIVSRPIPRHHSACLARSVDRAGIIPTCAHRISGRLLNVPTSAANSSRDGDDELNRGGPTGLAHVAKHPPPLLPAGGRERAGGALVVPRAVQSYAADLLAFRCSGHAGSGSRARSEWRRSRERDNYDDDEADYEYQHDGRAAARARPRPRATAQGVLVLSQPEWGEEWE